MLDSQWTGKTISRYELLNWEHKSKLSATAHSQHSRTEGECYGPQSSGLPGLHDNLLACRRRLERGRKRGKEEGQKEDVGVRRKWGIYSKIFWPKRKILDTQFYAYTADWVFVVELCLYSYIIQEGLKVLWGVEYTPVMPVLWASQSELLSKTLCLQEKKIWIILFVSFSILIHGLNILKITLLHTSSSVINLNTYNTSKSLS